MAELEGLQFQISASSDNASQHLNALAESLGRLRSAASNLRTLRTATGLIQDLSNATDGLNADGLSRLADALSRLNGLSISATAGRNFSALVDQIRSLTEGDIGRIERLADAYGYLSESTRNLRLPRLPRNLGDEQPQQNRELPNERRSNGVQQLLSQIDDLSSRSAPAFSRAISEMVSSLRSLATGSDGASRGLRGILKYTVGLPLTLGSGFASKIGAATKSLGHLFSAIKRIALYRLIRAVIKEITQGLREGIQHIYAYSNALGGEFASAMDSLATSSLYLKNSLGALAAPIIQSLIPAINWAIDRIVALMNVINMFVSALGGKATTTVAKRVETVFNAAGSAAGGAGGAAKKALKDLKTYTIGIDELNIIDDKDKAGSGSGSGGGGGVGGLDPSTMFEEVDVDKGVSNFAKALRTAFEKHNWSGMGVLLGAKFNELVGKIPWGDLGDKVGGGIGAIISTAYWTLKTMNYSQLGAGFAEFLNKAIGQINWREVGGLLVLRVTKAIDFLISFIEALDFKQVGKAISDFVKGVFDELTNWIKSKDWREIGDVLATKLYDLIVGIDWIGVLKSAFDFVVATQGGVQNFVLGFLFPKRSEVDFKEAGKNYFSKVKEGFNTEATKSDKPKFFVELKNDAEIWWQNAKTWWGDKVGKVKEFNTNVKNDASIWWGNVKRWWSEKVTQPVASFKTNVVNNASEWWSNVKRWWNEKKGTLDLNLSIKNNIQTLWNNVKTWWDRTVGTLTAKFEIKIPKITVGWKLDDILHKIKVPYFNITWNAEGAILKGAQLFGALGDKLLGGGEAGREALLPLDQNTGWMDTIAEKVRDTMATAANYEYSGMDKILSRLDAIEAMLGSVDDNTRIQAEKPSNTYVNISGRAVRDAVVRQTNADGYRFA